MLSYLLIIGLKQKNLVFLTDGERAIKKRISEVFNFCKYLYILDWPHITKSCKEHISMCISGDKKFRQDTTRKILRYLWVNRIDSAKSYLENLKDENIKSKKRLDDFIGYIERKKDDMACYAYRKENSLLISSCSVERTNNNLVARRQKHKGMSWSRNGNFALACISMAVYNNKLMIGSQIGYLLLKVY